MALGDEGAPGHPWPICASTMKNSSTFGCRLLFRGYPRDDPAAFVRLVKESWRATGFKQNLLVTGQAYWGEGSPAQPVMERKIKAFGRDFTDWQNIVGFNWWHAGGNSLSMSPAMIANIAERKFGSKAFASPEEPAWLESLTHLSWGEFRRDTGGSDEEHVDAQNSNASLVRAGASKIARRQFGRLQALASQQGWGRAPPPARGLRRPGILRSICEGFRLRLAHREMPRSRCRPSCHETPMPWTMPTTSCPRWRSRMARHGTSVKCSLRWMTANLPLASEMVRR